LDLEEGFELSLGFGSTSRLQWLEVTTTVDIDGGLSAPTSSERSIGAVELSFPSEGANSCLNASLAVDLSVSEGLAKRAVDDAHSLLMPIGSGPVSSAPESSMCASYPVQASMFPSMSLPTISGLGTALSGSPSSVSTLPPIAVSVLFGCSKLDSKGFFEGSSSLGAAALGERLQLSLLLMVEMGLPSTRPSPNWL
jgi:hypothetical protein